MKKDRKKEREKKTRDLRYGEKRVKGEREEGRRERDRYFSNAGIVLKMLLPTSWIPEIIRIGKPSLPIDTCAINFT